MVPHGQDAVCVVGDSVPFAWGVADDQTYSAQLERLLRASGKPLPVINGGAPSYNLSQSFDRWRIDLAPRWKCVVIVVHAANDMSLATHLRSQWSTAATWYEIRFVPYAGLSEWLATAYYLKRAFAPPVVEKHEVVQGLPVKREISELLKRELPALTAAGAKVILLPIDPVIRLDRTRPASGRPEYQQYLALWLGLIEEINTALKEAAEHDPSVEFLDIAGEMDQVDDKERFFLDFMHFNVEGHNYVARRLEEMIRAF